MRLALYLATVALVLSLALTAAASTGPSVGLAFRHVHNQHLRLCGLPASSVTWTGNNARERFQRCTIRAHFTITTPGPTQTPTPQPVDTRIPSTPIPTPTPRPTATAAIPPGCSDANLDACLLALIDASRAQAGAPPLILDATQSICSLAHSVHMAQEGYISHDQFPADICTTVTRAEGENVGETNISDPVAAAEWLHQEMMQEPHDYATCAAITNHACTIISRSYTRVGIGVYVASGSVWLTEGFVG